MNPTAPAPWLHVILFEPEIPPNTGNIMRLCANTGGVLHLVHPLGFALDEKKLRRAGMDYREWARVIEHAITTDDPQLRYPVSWGGAEMAALHDRIDDADWIGLGAIEDDADYIARFNEIFGVDIST